MLAKEDMVSDRGGYGERSRVEEKRVREARKGEEKKKRSRRRGGEEEEEKWRRRRGGERPVSDTRGPSLSERRQRHRESSSHAVDNRPL